MRWALNDGRKLIDVGDADDALSTTVLIDNRKTLVNHKHVFDNVLQLTELVHFCT